MGWGLRIKNCIYGGSLKNLIFRVGSQKKNIIKEGFSTNGELGQFADLRGGLTKKGVLLRGEGWGGDAQMHFMGN